MVPSSIFSSKTDRFPRQRQVVLLKLRHVAALLLFFFFKKNYFILRLKIKKLGVTKPLPRPSQMEVVSATSFWPRG
jgi:hypothetical protein